FEAGVKTAREAVDRGTAAAEQATRQAEHYASTSPAPGPSRPRFEAPGHRGLASDVEKSAKNISAALKPTRRHATISKNAWWFAFLSDPPKRPVPIILNSPIIETALVVERMEKAK